MRGRVSAASFRVGGTWTTRKSHVDANDPYIGHVQQALHGAGSSIFASRKALSRTGWGKLTDNDIQELDGRREVLIGKLQTRYAISYKDAERQVGDFETRRP